MKKDPRWMKSAVTASSTETVSLPWNRENRRRPEAMKAETQPAPAPRIVAKAAR